MKDASLYLVNYQDSRKYSLTQHFYYKNNNIKMVYKTCFGNKQNRQSASKVTLRRVRGTTVAVKTY